MEASNIRAMREALENITEYAKAAACHTEDAHLLGYLNQIAMWAEDALSAPPRNCGRISDAVIQSLRDKKLEMAGEIAEKDNEIARLRAALKPVLDCKVMGAVTAEIEPGKSEYCAAIIEKAQRIYYEG